jgi:hypothetical protein
MDVTAVITQSEKVVGSAVWVSYTVLYIFVSILNGVKGRRDYLFQLN